MCPASYRTVRILGKMDFHEEHTALLECPPQGGPEEGTPGTGKIDSPGLPGWGNCRPAPSPLYRMVSCLFAGSKETLSCSVCAALSVGRNPVFWTSGNLLESHRKERVSRPHPIHDEPCVGGGASVLITSCSVLMSTNNSVSFQIGSCSQLPAGMGKGQ